MVAAMTTTIAARHCTSISSGSRTSSRTSSRSSRRRHARRLRQLLSRFRHKRASFGFLWQNPSDNYAVVNVDGYIVLNGYLTVLADGGYVVLNDFSQLRVDASLDIHELWNEPFTSPIRQPAQSQSALDLDVSVAGIVAPGGIDGQNLYRGFDLQYSQFVMPPKGLAMFVVSSGIATTIRNGQAYAYFDGPSQQVLSPGVLITVLP